MHKNKQAWFFKFNKNVYVTLRGLLSAGYRTENTDTKNSVLNGLQSFISPQKFQIFLGCFHKNHAMGSKNKKFTTENQQNDKLTKRLSGKLSGAP